MPTQRLKLNNGTVELRKNGTVVGLTDRVYELGNNEEIVFADVEVKGELIGPLMYNGRKVQIIGAESIVGLEVGPNGARGPLWKQVRARILE